MAETATEAADQPAGSAEPQAPTGLLSLVMVLQFLKKPADVNTLAHEFCPDGQDMSPVTMVRAAKKLGIKARRVKIKPQALSEGGFPRYCT